MKTPRDLADDVEAMIDSNGLAPLLVYIFQICEDKAAHLEETWQDRAEAARWAKAARIIDTAAAKIEKLRIS